MTRADIINELNNRGYEVEAKDIVKNGITKQGMMLKTGNNVSPTVYFDDLVDRFDTVESLADECIRLFDDSLNRTPDIDVHSIFERDFILNNCFIGLQKSSDEDLIKDDTEFDGIEQYVYVRFPMGNGMGSVKLNPQIVDLANVTVETVFNNARKNTFAETEFVDLGDMIGLDKIGTVCVTNKHKFKGASAILNRAALEQYADAHDMHSIIVIPSSIHECIIVPYESDAFKMFDSIISDVNNSSVAPEERLADRVYVIEV